MSRSHQLPVPVGPAYDRPRTEAGAAGPFDAQLLGQAGARRGLKGGARVLADARTAYLEAEWTGDADRRLPPGVIARTRI